MTGSYDQAIIQENILQKCLFRYALEQNDPGLYYSYTTAFYRNCMQSELQVDRNRFTPECGKAKMTELGVRMSAINECYYDSFQFYDKEDRDKNFRFIGLFQNSILDEDMDKRNDHYLKYIPSILINGQIFWGKWHVKSILEALCAGIKKKPEMCYVEGGFHRAPSVGGMKVVWIIVLLLVILNIGIFVVCRKYMRRKISERVEESDLDHKVNVVVTSYLALKGKP